MADRAPLKSFWESSASARSKALSARKWGHAAVLANDGREALAALAAGAFDLVLMDVQMPHIDGYEATAIIRQRETGTAKHIPIVALTAHAMTTDQDRCREAGMGAYVSKPIRPAELRDVIERLGYSACFTEC